MFAALCGATATTAGRLDVKTAPDGTYSVTVDGVEWFAGSKPSFRHDGRLLSARDGSLELKGSLLAPVVGAERYSAEQRWAPRGLNSPIFITNVKVYDTYAVFTQSFPDGAKNTSTGARDDLVSAYPALTPKWQDPKGVVSFQGDMTGSDTKTGSWGAKSGSWLSGTGDMDACRIVTGEFTLTNSGSGYAAWTPKSSGGFVSHPGQYCGNGKGVHAPEVFHSSSLKQAECAAKCSILKCVCFDYKAGSPSGGPPIGQGIGGTGPIVVFDSDLKTSLVLSPFSNFMAANQKVVGDALSYGVMGGVTEIPKGYSISTVVSLGSGVNSAMDTWGDILLKQNGKERYAYQKDLAMQYLGYSTDNGAYYYYQTEKNKNYEDTLIDVLAYAKKESIPYKYVLLDSWWYFKGGDGVKTWEARPDIFPDGIAGFWKKTKWPTQLHNRMWSTDTTYAKQNGGKYNFIIDGSEYVVPDDQQFWNDLIGNKTTEAGAFMYEQDWLDVEFDKVKSLGENATLARTWMIQMDRGAAYANQTIQLCMSHVRHILQSVEMHTVTNARASGDYHPGNGQWNTGTTALLAHAVGIAPSKDNYWSTAVQSGTHYGPSTKEPHSRLQSAVITLTNGPVAPSDKIEASDTALIMRCCDAGGRLLSPDRPAAEIDTHFAFSAGFGGVDGHMWATYATVSGQKFSYVVGISLKSAYSLAIGELGYAADDKLLAVQADAAVTIPFTHDSPLHFKACEEDDFQLFLVAPRNNAFTLLGEPDKWISVSSQRFSDLTSASVKVHGQPGEKVTVRWAGVNGKIATTTCTLPESGVATSHVTAAGATCTSSQEVVV
jgi:hypothetical protein